MIVTSGGKIVKYSGKVVTAASQEVSPPNKYYYGVDTSIVRPDPMSLDISLLTQVNLSSNYPEFVITYPETIGFVIFIEFIGCPLRTAWEVEGLNSGRIAGGSFGLDVNLFPFPTTRAHDGKFWRVYVSNWQTLLSKPLIFKA